jgi:hypothetical protein
MLKFRFTELYDFVDNFIVVETNRDFNGEKKDFNYETKEIFFQNWLDKIIYLKCDLDSYQEDSDIKFQISKIQSVILNQLKSMKLDYEDYILFSEVDELPPKFSINDLDKILSFEPIAFLQKNFVCSTEYVNTENHLGTFCFTFSQFLRENNIIDSLYFNKNIIHSIYYRIVEGGFHFSKFGSVESIIKKTNLIEKKEITSDEVSNFKKNLRYWDDNLPFFKNYEGPLPQNIDIIEKPFFESIEPKRNIIILNFNQNLVDVSKFSEFTNILNFNFTKSYDYPHKIIVTDYLTNFNIFIPEKKFYNSEKFELEFGLNEIKNVLSKLNCLNQDIFEFYIYDEIFHLDEFTELTWLDIKNNRIYDLLKNPS